MTDPIADFLTRIRNAVKANHKVVEAPASKMKQEIARILHECCELWRYASQQAFPAHRYAQVNVTNATSTL